MTATTKRTSGSAQASTQEHTDPPRSLGLHGPALLTAIAIMLGGTAFPFVMSDATGRADHALALLLFWAMAAGFVRGVGFVPIMAPVRWLLSGWACAFSLSAFVAMKWWA
ncbi:MAG: hypothetical protein KA144_16585 [Xanthomonadaceae bacterium]|nr:hypothetical protein [Xanthomonadaceae bacterium]